MGHVCRQLGEYAPSLCDALLGLNCCAARQVYCYYIFIDDTGPNLAPLPVADTTLAV